MSVDRATRRDTDAERVMMDSSTLDDPIGNCQTRRGCADVSADLAGACIAGRVYAMVGDVSKADRRRRAWAIVQQPEGPKAGCSALVLICSTIAARMSLTSLTTVTFFSELIRPCP
jgi:hypothetical protein